MVSILEEIKLSLSLEKLTVIREVEERAGLCR